MNRVLSPLERRRGIRSPWHWMILCSLMIHGVVFFSVWEMGRLSQANILFSAPIQVSLVGGPSQVSPENPSDTPQAEQEENEQVIKKAKPLFRKPKLDTKRDLVSIRPSAVKEPEPAPVVQKKEEPNEPPIKRADMDDIRPEPQSAPNNPAGAASAIQRALGALGKTGGTVLSKEEGQYVRLIQERIGENWQAYLPPGENKILGQARIIIAEDGSIKELALLKGSGKPSIDASFVRALKRLVLPPPPRRFVGDPLIIQFHG